MQPKHAFPFPLRLIVWFVVSLALWGGDVRANDFLSDETYENGENAKVADPIEPINRAIFTVNDKFYLWVLDPVATGYSKVLPANIRGCVGNFFYNLGEPVRSANCLLQGRFRDSGLVLSRFMLNTLFGVFGLADPAGHEFAIPAISASLGETLAVWGIGDGFYLVAPLLGPSTVRDLTGTVVDSMAMASYYPWNDDEVSPLALTGVNTVNRTSLHLGEYQDLKSMSFDPYVAFRNGYFQMRAKERTHSQPNKEQKGNSPR
jgi:phospholipid-binding lipoprotein MlaA